MYILSIQANQKSQSERDHAKSQFLDAQKSEQTAKVDLEEAGKRVSTICAITEQKEGQNTAAASVKTLFNEFNHRYLDSFKSSFVNL